MKKLLVILFAVLLIFGFSAYIPLMSESDPVPQETVSEEPPSLIREEPQITEYVQTPPLEAAAVQEEVQNSEPVTLTVLAENDYISTEVLAQTKENEDDAVLEDHKEAEVIENSQTAEQYNVGAPAEETPVSLPETTEPARESQDAEPKQQDIGLEEPVQNIEPAEPPSITEPEKSREETDMPAPHEHSFVISARTEPGCTEAGKEIYTCSCGESYEESIDALGHDWVLASEYEVIDKETYCTFRYAQIICTSPACYENGDRTGTPLSVFSAKDYGYSASEMFGAYDAHAYAHLTNGEQASYTADFISDTAPADMYEYLLSQQNCKPRSIRDLTLVPAVTHTEQVFRCTRCGAEK